MSRPMYGSSALLAEMLATQYLDDATGSVKIEPRVGGGIRVEFSIGSFTGHVNIADGPKAIWSYTQYGVTGETSGAYFHIGQQAETPAVQVTDYTNQGVLITVYTGHWVGQIRFESGITREDAKVTGSRDGSTFEIAKDPSAPSLDSKWPGPGVMPDDF